MAVGSRIAALVRRFTGGGDGTASLAENEGGEREMDAAPPTKSFGTSVQDVLVGAKDWVVDTVSSLNIRGEQGVSLLEADGGGDNSPPTKSFGTYAKDAVSSAMDWASKAYSSLNMDRGQRLVDEQDHRRTTIEAIVDAKDAVGDQLSSVSQGIDHTVRSGGVHITNLSDKMSNFYENVKTSFSVAVGMKTEVQAELESATNTLNRKGKKHGAVAQMGKEVTETKSDIDRREKEKVEDRAYDDIRQKEYNAAKETLSQYESKHPNASKSEILAEKLRLLAGVQGRYDEAKAALEAERQEAAKIRNGDNKGIEPQIKDFATSKALEGCTDFKSASKVLRESKAPKFTLSAESNVKDGTGTQVWDHPKFPAEQPKGSKMTPEEYQAERESHQVKYTLKDGKVTGIEAGEKANFTAAVSGQVVSKRGGDFKHQFATAGQEIAVKIKETEPLAQEGRGMDDVPAMASALGNLGAGKSAYGSSAYSAANLAQRKQNDGLI